MSLHPNDPIIFVFEPHQEWARDLRVRIVTGRAIAVYEEPGIAGFSSWFNAVSSGVDNAVGSFLIRDEGVTWARLDSPENRDALLAAYKLSESDARD